MLLNVEETRKAVTEALQNCSFVQTLEECGTKGCFLTSNIKEYEPLEEIEQSFMIDQKSSYAENANVITGSIEEALQEIEKGVGLYGYIGRSVAHLTYLKVAEHEGDVVVNFRMSVAPLGASVNLKQVYTLIETGNREVFLNADGSGAALRINGELVNFLNLEVPEEELTQIELLKVLSMTLGRTAKEPELVKEHFASILKLV